VTVAGDAEQMGDVALERLQAALQDEARVVLAGMAELDALRSIGPLLVTGSYVSGLMCWRDLDVGALVGPDFGPTDVLNVVAGIMAAVDVVEFTYRDERGNRSPTGERRDERFHLPLQVVWKPGQWRFDLSLWLYDDHANVADWHRQLRDRLLPEQRRAVLRIKHDWCRRPEYPDEVGGTDIYTAVLDDGISDADSFGRWLLERRSRPDSWTRDSSDGDGG
jgi:hypothetical protein